MGHSTPSLMIPPSLSTSSPLTCTPTRPSTRPSTIPLQMSSSDEIYHCGDPVNVSFCSLADLHSPAGYEPKDLAEEDNLVQVRPLFFHDSAESIATVPPESDLNDEQIRAHAGFTTVFTGEKHVLSDHEFITPCEENSVSSSSHFRESTGKPAERESTGGPVALFSNKRKSSQEALSD